jgi:hypothetical protein
MLLNTVELSNEQLLRTAYAAVPAGSLRSRAAFFVIAPQQNCGRYTALAHRR